MGAEQPQWQREARLLIPKWNTTEAVTEEDLNGRLFDVSGRPLMEDKRDNIAEVPFVYKPTSLTDRKGKKVNTSALESVSAHFEDALGILSYLRSVIYPYPKRPKTEDMLVVVEAATALPEWLVLKSDDPIENGTIPMDVSAVVKMSRGLAGPFHEEVEERSAAKRERESYQPPTFLNSTADFMRYITDNGYLISDQRDIACPAPLHMIERTVEVLFDKPVEGMGEAAQRLSLSDDDVSRIKKLGLALGIISRVTDDYAVIGSAVSLMFMKARSLGYSRDQAWRAIQKVYGSGEERDKLRRIAQGLNKANKFANEALLRNQAQKVSEETVLAMFEV